MVGKMKRRPGEESVRSRGQGSGWKGQHGQAQQRMSLAGACMCKGASNGLGRLGCRVSSEGSIRTVGIAAFPDTTEATHSSSARAPGGPGELMNWVTSDWPTGADWAAAGSASTAPWQQRTSVSCVSRRPARPTGGSQCGGRTLKLCP